MRNDRSTDIDVLRRRFRDALVHRELHSRRLTVLESTGCAEREDLHLQEEQANSATKKYEAARERYVASIFSDIGKYGTKPFCF